MGQVDLIVCSPPFTGVVQTRDEEFYRRRMIQYGRGTDETIRRTNSSHGDYGTSPGQLGGMKEGTFPEDGTMTTATLTPDTWAGCYSEGWQGLITDEAFAHPAKFSRALIRRIYAHLADAGRLKPGMTVLDPFGGVALGGLDAMFAGLHWIGCELEYRFHQLGLENIARWNERYRGWPNWGTARLLNGDSRRLADVARGADCVVSSPPYTTNTERLGKIDWTKTKHGSQEAAYGSGKCSYAEGLPQGYGTTPGQLGSLKEGDFDAVVSGADAIISSPPYEGTCVALPDGAAERQMANLAKAVSEGRVKGRESLRVVKKGFNSNSVLNSSGGNYGQTPGQLGSEQPDTFWASARTIVAQCHLLLKPGGVACWVVKDFVRKRQIVPFCDQWRRLCEAVGFRTLHEHRASLVADSGDQLHLFGEPEPLKTERKSFFRRLAEKKGSPEINWETVLCMEKPT